MVVRGCSRLLGLGWSLWEALDPEPAEEQKQGNRWKPGNTTRGKRTTFGSCLFSPAEPVPTHFRVFLPKDAWLGIPGTAGKGEHRGS